MVKFKKGDRVIMILPIDSEGMIPQNSIGTVNENESQYPYVLWDYINNSDFFEEAKHNYEWAVGEDEMELYEGLETNINYEIY